MLEAYHTLKSAFPEKAGDGTPTALLEAKSMRQSTLTENSSGATCPTCGDRFDSEYGVSAHHWQVHGEKLRVDVSCDECGATLTRRRCEVYETNFCDSDCMYAYQSGEAHPNANQRTEPCVTCGQSVTRCEAHQRNRTFCSRECYGDWLSENRSGSDHPGWRGGVSHTDMLRKSLPGDSWPQQAKGARDDAGRACEICGRSPEDKRLDAHHIIPLVAGGTNGDYNLMALCDDCHKTAESYTRDLPGMEAVLAE